MTRLTALLFLVPAIALAEITGHDIVIDGQTLNLAYPVNAHDRYM